jgi:hypothetical protein
VNGECSFDRTLCGWRNDTLHVTGKPGSSGRSSGASQLVGHKISHTSGGVAGLLLPAGSSGGDHQSYSHRSIGSSLIASDRSGALGAQKPMVSWRLANLNSRPANLQDHTFRAPVGYVYFDVFNQHQLQQPILRSARFPAISGDETLKMRCLSFWFSAFGRGDNSLLSVYLIKFEESEGGDSAGSAVAGSSSATSDGGGSSASADAEKSDGRIMLWSIQSRYLETRRNLWYYAQTAVNAETEYQVSVIV